MQNDKINADKILIKDVFQKWYLIPNYQRQYVWESDEIIDLLQDISDMYRERQDAQFFLGTYVFRNHMYTPIDGSADYEQNDLLDGQQRLTTLWLVFAVIRDLAQDKDLKDTCRERVLQKGNRYMGMPEIMRISFDEGLREGVKDFCLRFIKPDGGTTKDAEIDEYVRNHKKDISIVNIANAIKTIRRFWDRPDAIPHGDFVKYLLSNVLMIYVSTQDFADAFRLFTVLNDRGVQLRSSDILKTKNLGAIVNPKERNECAAFWEDAERCLGDGFDRFLNHIRTILVKEKAKATLLAEFENKIYAPKDGKTGAAKEPLLKRGKDTFDFIKRYLENYQSLFDADHNDYCGNYRFDNLLTVIQYAVPASDWVPPLLHYYERFKLSCIEEFYTKLIRKFIGDWISQVTTADRIERMNRILREIEDSENENDLLSSEVFDFDSPTVGRVLSESVYGRRYALVLVLLMDYMQKDASERMTCSRLSIEHILPQTPKETSGWRKDFTDDQRSEWQDKIGNLIAISGAKNASLGRLDYQEKKVRYFERRVPGFAHSQKVMATHSTWTMDDLLANQNESVAILKTFFGI